MASSYTPTNIKQGFGAETTINQNFDDIKIALDELLSRDNSTDNAMDQDLDVGNNRVINHPAPASPTDLLRLTDLNSLEVPAVIVTLDSEASIVVDTIIPTYVKIVLDQATTITLSGTPTDGKTVLVTLKQDVIGSRLVTWSSSARFSSGLPEPVLSTAAESLDYLFFRYNADDAKFDLILANIGF